MTDFTININLRNAEASDISIIMEILADGRSVQRAAGFRQWEDGYPPREAVAVDVEARRGYLFEVDGRPAGYACIMVDDPDYAPVAHCFRLQGPFAVIHRMAMAHTFCGKGFARLFFALLEAEVRRLGVEIVRVDTAYENKTMQHLMDSLGYDCLGHTDYCWGPRLTYEKSLESVLSTE